MARFQKIMGRWHYLIVGVALLVMVTFFADFLLSYAACAWRIINLSATDNSRGVLYTKTFDLLEYKHHTWKNTAMATLLVGEEPSRGFLDKGSMAEHISKLKPRVFDYIINNRSLCKTPGQISFVISVLTAPNHFEDRMILRSTYGRHNLFSRYPSRTVFFLGAVRDPTLQESILAESNEYGDIIQADFIDSYYNLSYKALTQLQWFNAFCGNAKYLVKVDDDLYFDVFQIVKIVKQITSVSKFIIGNLRSGGQIYRKFGKYRVGSRVLPKERCFPPYFQGWLYIIPNALFSDLYNTAMRTPVVQLEDVYITGLVMGQLQDIKYIHFSGKAPDGYFMPTHPRLAQECDTSCKLPLWCRHLANLHEKDEELIGAEELAVILSHIDCKKSILKR